MRHLIKLHNGDLYLVDNMTVAATVVDILASAVKVEQKYDYDKNRMYFTFGKTYGNPSVEVISEEEELELFYPQPYPEQTPQEVSPSGDTEQ